MKTKITITNNVPPSPPLLSYTEMIRTKGVFDILNKHGERAAPHTYVINTHGVGNAETSTMRPLYVSNSGHVETLSAVAWECCLFRKTTDSVTLTFSNEG